MDSGNAPHCHEVMHLFHMTDVTSSIVIENWHTALMALKIEYNKMRSIPPLQQMASHGWENLCTSKHA